MSENAFPNPPGSASASAMHADSLGIDPLKRFVAAAGNAAKLAIQSLDQDGVIQLWNAASSEIYGIPAHEALGKNIHALLPHHAAGSGFRDSVTHVRRTGLPARPRDCLMRTANGKEVWVYSSTFPVFINGDAPQIFCMQIDITQCKEEEQVLLAIGANYRSLFEISSDAILLLRMGIVIEINPAALRLFGFSDKASVLGRSLADFSAEIQVDGSTSAVKAAAMLAVAEESGNSQFEWCFENSKKKAFEAEVLLTSIPVNGERLVHAVVRDISKRKAAEQSMHLAAQVFENSREAILITDKERRIISLNRAFMDMTGYSESELIGNTPHIYNAGLHDSEFYQDVWNQINVLDHWQGEILDQRRDGTTYPAWVSITAFRDAQNDVCNYMGIVCDITQRKKSEEYTRHLAEHDFLTDLPNRVLLLDRLGQALAVAKRNRTQLAILFIDLDRFKNINDTLGHHIGDKLLQEVTVRLKKCVRGIDTVSRQGGDEFVIMLADIGGVEQAAHIAENIMDALAQPYQLEGTVCKITASIGLSTYPNDGEDMDTLIKNADIAMYHAKECGRSGYQFFNADMNVRILQRLSIENCLQQAIENHQFILQYQPQIDVATGRIIGAEALIRWQHPEQGMLAPTSFIEIAEDCGLIIPIGEWVLRSACQQARLWQDQGLSLVISVNLSAAQFRQKNLPQIVQNSLAEFDLSPELLELEISDEIFMESNEHLMNSLATMKEMGVNLAIDNFGTSYASLRYLKNLPVKKIKIDQSLIHTIGCEQDGSEVIDAIILMAKIMKLHVIAEGVETCAQMEFLQAHGCGQCQGNLLSRPMLPGDLSRFMLAH